MLGLNLSINSSAAVPGIHYIIGVDQTSLHEFNTLTKEVTSFILAN